MRQLALTAEALRLFKTMRAKRFTVYRANLMGQKNTHINFVRKIIFFHFEFVHL